MGAEGVRLTEQQVEEIKKAFFSLNEDDDDERKAVVVEELMRLIGEIPSESEVFDIMKSLPSSKKPFFYKFIGKMKCSYKELKKREATIRRALKIFDLDGDGFIAAMELKYLITNLGDRLTSEEADAMISEVDKYDSGCIYYEDLVTLLTRK